MKALDELADRLAGNGTDWQNQPLARFGFAALGPGVGLLIAALLIGQGRIFSQAFGGVGSLFVVVGLVLLAVARSKHSSS